MKSKKRKNKQPAQRLDKVPLSFRRNLLPPLAGLLVFLIVFFTLNSQWLSGKIAVARQNNQIQEHKTTAADASASPDAQQLSIEKIGVSAPIVFSETEVNEASFQTALQNGVVHYPGTATPGSQGNIVIFGHSSNQWWAPGQYKFVFALLDQLEIDDRIMIDYQGQHFVYRVKVTRVVLPTELSVLNPSATNRLTLITCTPVGTNAKRLVVEAEQVEPAPPAANAVEPPAESIKNTKLPTAAPSIWENLKQLF